MDVFILNSTFCIKHHNELFPDSEFSVSDVHSWETSFTVSKFRAFINRITLVFTFSAIRSIEKVLHLPKKSTSRF